MLANLGQASGFLALPFTILKVACSVVDFTASTPLLDAAVAMIPGLSAQSKTDNNYELARLRQPTSAPVGPPQRFYISSDFSPNDAGWKIWEYARDPKLRAANAAADLLVFDGANDLEVDTSSMIDLVAAPGHEFKGADSRVHHTNYFRQPKTMELIRTWLSIP